MRLEIKKLMKLDVQTKAGVMLGHVKDVILETEGQSVIQYEVGNLFGKKYLVSREQVLSINESKMIVDDNVLKIEDESMTEIKLGGVDVSTAMMDSN